MTVRICHEDYKTQICILIPKWFSISLVNVVSRSATAVKKSE
jgi:hypothetical protein